MTWYEVTIWKVAQPFSNKLLQFWPTWSEEMFLANFGRETRQGGLEGLQEKKANSSLWRFLFWLKTVSGKRARPGPVKLKLVSPVSESKTPGFNPSWLKFMLTSCSEVREVRLENSSDLKPWIWSPFTFSSLRTFWPWKSLSGKSVRYFSITWKTSREARGDKTSWKKPFLNKLNSLRTLSCCLD